MRTHRGRAAVRHRRAGVARVARVALWLGGLLFVSALVPRVRAAAQPRDEDPLETPSVDPNDTPFMTPRHGGARPDGARLYASGPAAKFGDRTRFRLTVKPLYASLRTQFLGRSGPPLNPKRGAGAGLDVDVPLWGPLWARASGSYSGHRVTDEFLRDEDDELVKTAAAGTIHIGHAAASLVYVMDRGRWVPLLELGLGPLWARTPPGLQDGQTGQPCLGDNVCDFGLVCEPAQNVCRPATQFVVHGGLGLDTRLGKRWSLGAGIRYFAFLSSPGVFPIYLQGALRLGLRL